MNHFEVTGNLVKDVEVRFTNTQKAVALFRVAENIYDYKTKGQKAQYFNVVAFGKKAEVIADHFVKGSRIHIIGSLRFNEYETEQGEKRSNYQVHLSDFDFCEKKPKANP